ncbi:hypothetical protein ACIP5Y_07620 [Nocardia sp. NPDC088792]|uniref:hypothetical protein n=1 Tax=Nocardia sp. NPDC088792 TaxID=3364332 RepID=UPI0037FF0808
MTRTNAPAWRMHARQALGAAIDEDVTTALTHLGEMLRLGPDTVVAEASMLWIDELFAVVAPPPPPCYVPDNPPAYLRLSEEDLWAMRLMAARVNGDGRAAQALFAEAGRDWDSASERLGHLLALVAMKLKAPLASQV